MYILFVKVYILEKRGDNSEGKVFEISKRKSVLFFIFERNGKQGSMNM
jgi:hypothetical protein